MTLSLTGNDDLALTAISTLALTGAEIVAFDPQSDRAFVTSSAGLQIVNMSNPANPSLISNIDFTAAPFNLGSTDVSSVAVKNGVIAVSIIASPKTDPGHVVLIDSTGALLDIVQVGANPDMVTFTPDGTKVLVANEGEVDADVVNDPEGSVSIIDVTTPTAATVVTAGFTAFNGQAAALTAEGVRLYVGLGEFANSTVAQDLEPEYIAISPDGTTAFVTLQENNAIGILDIATGTFTDIVPLGLKDWSGLLLDSSDRDAGIQFDTGDPVFGQYMPDAIDSYAVGGNTYYVIANEGDDRGDFVAETARLSTLNLDNATFPNEAALLAAGELGRLTVPSFAGLNGDTDGDGDIDQILSYGGRSFSILDDTGAIIFDSADHIDRYVAANFPANYDDSRSDNKGAEPESVEIATVNGKTYAFIGLERYNGTMIYDITDPQDVQFVNFATNAGDTAPEGSTFVSAADSPTGTALYLVANEGSNTLTTNAVTADYTLQLLHFADGEAGLLASQTAPNLAALVDAFDDDYANTLILAGGDNFIPGPFYAAGADPSITSVIPGGNVQGRPDIAIHNAIGVQASTIGNHEFDFGSQGFSDAFRPSGAWTGALFPYLSANLDFSGDSVLNPAFTETIGVGGLEEASSLNGRIAPSAVITEGGEKIGLVAVTTQLLEQISSPTGTEVKGFPTGPGANGEADNMALLAQQLQPYIDDLIAQGVNKIVLMSHLQLLGNERALAPLLTGVDVILAAGSNTRLGDADDDAEAFPGHAADFADTYPIVTAGADGKTSVIVNTDNEYTYLGRLVIDFDANGEIITDSLTNNVAINGAYAATDANVAEAWGVNVEDLETTAFANGTRGDAVRDITDAVQSVIDVKNGNVFGYSDVYVEGARASVRSQETNLGNLTADANADAARDALALANNVAVVSIKNGGGIRSQIGTTSAPDPIDGTVDFIPNPGGTVSQLDVENSLRFDNRLMIFDTTPQGLLNILNHGNATTAGSGGFIQLSGVSFSFDPTAPAGSRVKNVVLTDANGNVTQVIAENGVIAPSAPTVIQAVILNFTANGGDGYPIKANGENFRFLLNDGSVSAVIPETENFTSAAVVPANALGEQQAFANYMSENFGTPATAYDQAETSAAFDTRIQNLTARTDGVFDQIDAPVGLGAAGIYVGTDGVNDVFDGGGRNDQLFGFGGDDTLNGESDNDGLSGGAGNDVLDGGTGNDVLLGGANDDSLFGRAGNDVLIGGSGVDFLRGGIGSDTYVFQSVSDSINGAARDFIADFSRTDDIIDLSAIDAVAGGTDNAFTFVAAFSGAAGELMVREGASRSAVLIDIDGDGRTDMSFVVNAIGLDASDFVL